MGIYANQLLVIVIFWTLFLSGCNVVDDVRARQQQAIQVQQAQQTQATAPDMPPPVEAKIHCPDHRRDDCGLLVKLNAQGEQVDLNVRLHIDEGIVFRSDYDEAVALDDNGAEGRKAKIRLMPQESREILFPYQMDRPVLPGAYRVEVVATNANTLEVFGDAVAQVFIYRDDEGEYHMLSSQSEYNTRFLTGFSEGKLNVFYNIILEEKEKPRKGTILVRIDSKEDDYAPILELESMGGVKFVPDTFGLNTVLDFGDKVSRAFPRIDKDGTRIAQFPFVYDKNGQSVEGVYSFVATLSSATDDPQHESAPVAIKVVSDPTYREERWLEETFLEPYIIDEIGIGNKVVDANMEENLQLAQQKCETTWHEGDFPTDIGKPDWDFRMSDFDGTLCQLFLMRYAGKIFMNWSEFSTIAIEKNDNISSADEHLDDHEIYLMPRPNSVP